MQKKTHKYHSKTKEKSNIMTITISVITIIILATITTAIIKNKNNTSKISKIGNNSTSQEIVDYILNTNSYDAEIEVEVKSNKNSNKYKLRQSYINKEDNMQEVIEPANIKGLKLIREGSTLRIENTKLNITKVIEDYKDISQNNLDLISFIENYKNNSNSKFKEENNQVIMETTAESGNNYQKYETLYVSKENGTPIKMEIKDTNQNTIIYIIYKEMNIK